MTANFATIIFLSSLAIFAQGQIDLMHCRNPLGMQDKRIPDDHLTASSFHARGTGPKFARLDREEGDGAWCPKGVLHPGDSYHWLQVKLPSLSFISLIATQGRDEQGRGQEYTPSYMLNYSRDGLNWHQWKNFRGDVVLDGNTDARSIARQKLNPGIPSVHFIRFIPLVSNAMSVCARIELSGCEMKSSVVQYDIPKPGDGDEISTRLSETWSFDDEFYDGRRERLTYHGGLGQLTDGVLGSSDIHKTVTAVPTRTNGFDYVGWQNNKRGDRYVTLTFFFEDVKNFTSMRVHCLSSSIVGSSFFSNVQVSFSLNGRTFPSTPYASRVVYDVPNALGDESRMIVVPLGRAMARYLQARFKIRGDWLLVSEVEFEAVRVEKDPAPELMFPELPTVAVLVLPVTWSPNEEKKSSTLGAVSEAAGNVVKEAFESDEFNSATDPSVTQTEPVNVVVIVCSLAAVIVLLVLIVLLLICYHRRYKKTMTPPRYSYVSATSPAVPTPSVTLCLTDQRAAFTTTACAMPEKCSDPLYHEIASARGVMTTNEYLEPNDVLRPHHHIPEVAHLAQQSLGRDRRFEQPDVTMCASGVRDGVMTIPPYAETSVRVLPPPYATPLQGPFGNNLYAVPCTSSSPVAARRKHLSPPKYTATPSEASTLLADDSKDDVGFQMMSSQMSGEHAAIEFPREGLEFVEKLGEGQFGEVRLCKADASLRRYAEQNGMTLNGEPDEPVLVAVKALRVDASANTKEDFLKEVKVMSRLRDPNIVQLLAVCTEDEPFAMITEYMENGDLHEYLNGFEFDESSYGTQDRRPASRSDLPECSTQLPTISLTVLMSVATQIAAGMKYLSSLNFVHRDLASRNCLVGKDHTIRIADFGMSRNMYQGDYYKIQGKAVLPIRWMSWECILLGKFSTASDVWAFGVTMWEIFTLCKCQPFHAMDDKEVIENMHHIYQNTEEEVYLPKPKACPTPVFDMVKQCWKRECQARPGFDLLYSFFKERV